MLSDVAQKELDSRLVEIWSLFRKGASCDKITAEVHRLLTDHTGVSQHDSPNAHDINANRALPHNWRRQHGLDRSFACGQLVEDPNDPDGWELYELFLRLMDVANETRVNRRDKNLNALRDDLEDYLRGRRLLAATDSPAATAETPEEQEKWMRIADAARITCINRGTIKRAADSGDIADNGKRGGERRLDRQSFTIWAEEKAKKPEPQETDAAINRKLKRAETD